MTCQIVHHKDKTDSQNAKKKSRESSMSSALVSLDAGSHTGAGNNECKLSIVSVEVKMCKGTKIVQTHAFLDPRSTATFCTEALMAELNASGKKMKVLLKTTGQEPVPSYRLSGMEVAALKGNTFLKLPGVFIQKSIPVTHQKMTLAEGY